MHPFVNIIIINWNGIEDTLHCLSSLEKVDYDNFVVTVVDNDSINDEAARIRQAFPKVTIIRSNKNLGFTGGNNLALKRLKSEDYVLLLNNDTELTPNFLTELIAYSEEQSKVGIVGPCVNNWVSYLNQTSVQSFGAKINPWNGSSRVNKGVSQKAVETDMISGCCMLIKRSVINAIGILDDSYFCYYEETDYCVRAKKAGFFTCAVPSSIVFHKGGATSAKISGFHEKQMIKNRFFFIAKNYSRIHLLTTILYVFLFYIFARTILLVGKGYYDTVPSLWKGAVEGFSNSIRLASSKKIQVPD